ncbi:EpsG family protein [Robertmurraya sp. FSL R5-0851]|uniref:EpsG family protein n=1 Tax=Robertmurraya sp. FSL R5-0851 TaxID=2921584 RepID=UPI0030F866B7
MTFLWWNLAIVFIFSFFARYFSNPVLVNGVPINIRLNRLLVAGVMVSLVVISGLRKNIGDTFFYMHSFKVSNFTWDSIVKDKDFGFGILQMLLKNYSTDPQTLIFVTALITNILIVLTLSKYSGLFELSTYAYITGGLFLVSMNGIRQVLAAAIIFTATRFIISGNWIMYFLVVLIAATFHQSALILLPIYFLVRYKAWSRATIILLFFSVIIVVGFDLFSSLLFSAIEDTQYGHYSNFDEGGANVIRVAVYAAPLVIAFLGREKLREIFPSSDYIVNMALIGLIFMIISTQNWIFARFSIYFNLYQLILVSWVVQVFRGREQRFIYYLIVIFYFLYYFYESVISLNIYYESNYL